MTLVMFNMLNMSFSSGLQIRYVAEVDTWSILCMLISFTIVMAVIASQFVTDSLEFGEYSSKFKEQRLYMTITLLYRFLLGLLLALLNEWPQGGIVLVLLSGALLTYIFACEPFMDPLQNTRSKMVHFVHVLILLISYFYRMEAKYDEVSSSYFLAPAYLQVAVVGAVVMLSVAFLFYEAVRVMREKWGREKDSVDGSENRVSICSAPLEVGKGESIEAEVLDG